MKRTLLIISLFFLCLSSKGQNLTFVDANNLVVNSSNWTNYWKPNTGEILKIEGINGTTWLEPSSTYTQVWINSSEITNGIKFPLWIGSSDSIKIKPYGSSTSVGSNTAIINYLIFKNEP